MAKSKYDELVKLAERNENDPGALSDKDRKTLTRLAKEAREDVRTAVAWGAKEYDARQKAPGDGKHDKPPAP